MLLWSSPSASPPAAPSRKGHLRIGLGDDPDGLDPTTSRFYTTRIVFAALCDKLFDIDEKAGIVPQLALGAETSADGKTVTIKLRPGVKFHDGEPFNAEAAKYSLERHMNMKGSFRKPELAAVDSVEVVDPLDREAQPQAALLAPARPAHRPRRHDGLAQGGRSGGRQVRAEAGMRRPLQVRRARRRRTASSSRSSPTTGTRTSVFIDKITYLPIVDSTVRLANLRSGGLDMMERLLATDIKTVRDDPKLKLGKAVSLGFFGLLVNVANGPKADNPLGKDPRVRQAFDLAIDREALNQVVFNGEFVPGNQWVNPQSPWYQQGFPGSQARHRQGQGAPEGSRHHRPAHDRLHGRQ